MASTHKHIRSGTAHKRPTTAIADGQIALATNSASPGLFFKDSTGASIIKIGPVHVGATAPNASPAGSAGNSTGEIWLDNSLTPVGVKIWNGSAWVNATPIGTTTVQGLLELATSAETQAGSDTDRAVTPAGLQSKLSDSISTTSSTTIASSTAVKTAYDLANAALPKSGGTITGNLEIGTSGSLTFEGATADAFETTLAVVDPTADRTITLPNTTGTVVTTGDTGTVTSTMLLDGTILNADINASAAIVDTKLATIATAGKVSNSATTATDSNTALAIVSRDASGNFTAGTITGSFSGTTFVGTTSLALNRSSANQGLTGISSVALPGATSGTVTVQPAAIAGTTTITLPATTGTVITTGDTGTVTSTMLLDGTILNADVNASAAIAGTKISPDFGSQTIVTTGVHSAAGGSAAAPSITFTGDTNTGIYSPGADQVAISTNGTGRLTVSTTAVSSTLAVDHPLGAVGTPSITFTGDLNTGFWSPTADTIAASTGGSERLRIDSSGRLGLGSSSPGTMLDVRGIISLGSSNLASAIIQKSAVPSGSYSLVITGGGGLTSESATVPTDALAGSVIKLTGGPPATDDFGGGIQYYANGHTSPNAAGTGNQHVFYTRSAANTYAERMRITAGGLVGIGSTAPSNNLEVGLSATNSSNGITITNNQWFGYGARLQFRNLLTSAGTVGETASIYGEGDGSNAGRLVFHTTAGGTASQKMQLDSSGRLLVGTSSNSFSSTIVCQGNSGSSSGEGIVRLNRGTAVPTSGQTLGAIVFGQSGSNDGAYILGEADAAWSASNDYPTRLVFSTTADGASSPTQAMVINSSQDVNITRSTAATNSTGWYGVSANAAVGSISISRNGSNVMAFFHTSNANGLAGSPVGTISITTTATTYATSSDYRLKENVVPLTGAIDRINQLKPSQFNFIADPDKIVDGFLAHEAQAVVPECVTGEKDAVDDDGNPVYQGIDQSKLVPLLTAALQEAIGRIETLEAEVTALKAS